MESNKKDNKDNKEKIQQYRKGYYIKNKESIKTRTKVRYWKDPKKSRECDRGYYHNNIEARRLASKESSKKARAKNPEKYNATTRKWRSKHPERMDRARKEWAKNNVGKISESRRNRRAKQANLQGLPYIQVIFLIH